MNWFTWQQLKRQFLLFGIFAALFAALVIPTGVTMWDTYQQALDTCKAVDSCDGIADTLFLTGWESRLLMAMKAIVVALPFVLALFLGVPLIAREYSEGTNLLAWTQDVSRRRWLGVRLGWVLGATIVLTGVFAALSTWWWQTGNALYLDRFQPLNFGIQGIVPVTFAIFAVAVGIAFGAWFRRLLPAMALTLGLLVAVQTLVPSLLRSHYVQPVSYTAAINMEGGPPDRAPIPPNAGAAWVTNSYLASPKDGILDWNNPPAVCSFTREQIETQRKEAEQSNQRAPKGGFYSKEGGPLVGIACLVERGYIWHVEYHPAYRYWNFQRIEAGVYLALSLIPLATTYLLVSKRDA